MLVFLYNQGSLKEKVVGVQAFGKRSRGVLPLSKEGFTCRGFLFGRRKYVKKCNVFLGHSKRIGESNVDDYPDAKNWGKYMVGYLPGRPYLWSDGCRSGSSGGNHTFARQSNLASGVEGCISFRCGECSRFDPEFSHRVIAVSRAEGERRLAASDPSYGRSVELQ